VTVASQGWYDGAEFSLDHRFFIGQTADEGPGSVRKSVLVTLATGVTREVDGLASGNPSVGRRTFTRDGTRVLVMRGTGSTFDIVAVTTDAPMAATTLASSATTLHGLTEDDRFVVFATATSVAFVPLLGGTPTLVDCGVFGKVVFRPDLIVCDDASTHALSAIALPSGTKTAIATPTLGWNVSPKGRWINYPTSPTSPRGYVSSPTGTAFEVTSVGYTPDDSALLYGDPTSAGGRTLMKRVGGVTTTLALDARVLAVSPDGTKILSDTPAGGLKVIPVAGGAAVALLASGCTNVAVVSFSDDGSRVAVNCTSAGFVGPTDGSAPLVSVGASIPLFSMSPDGSKFIVDSTVRSSAAPATAGVPILWDDSDFDWDYAVLGSHWIDSTHALFLASWLGSIKRDRCDFQRGVYLASGL
jgi:hypothetical protein